MWWRWRWRRLVLFTACIPEQSSIVQNASIASRLRAKAESNAPHGVRGGAGHLVLLLHGGEHALPQLHVGGHRSPTAAIAATAAIGVCRV